MEITQIRIFPVHEEKLKAFVSVVLDECFVVSDIKIIEGGHGLFVSMPSKKRKNGTFRDIAHPLNSQTRQRFEDAIIGRYREVLREPAAATPASDVSPDAPEAIGGARAPLEEMEDRTWT